MIEALLVLTGLVIGAAVAVVAVRRRRGAQASAPVNRILFPYVGSHLSVRALDAALRVARFENAMLVPVYLVPVPMAMPLESPIPRECEVAFELQEAIEQRAAAAGIPVDARIVRGRTVRHALRELLRPARRRRRDCPHRRPERGRRRVAARARRRRGRRRAARRRIRPGRGLDAGDVVQRQHRRSTLSQAILRR